MEINRIDSLHCTNFEVAYTAEELKFLNPIPEHHETVVQLDGVNFHNCTSLMISDAGDITDFMDVCLGNIDLEPGQYKRSVSVFSAFRIMMFEQQLNRFREWLTDQVESPGTGYWS